MSVETTDTFISATQKWLQQMVIGLNLCPFAKKPWQKQSIRFHVFHGKDDLLCLEAFADELGLLLKTPETETTLFIVPTFDNDFYGFLDLIDQADYLLDKLDLRGKFQLAHFHPKYLFSGEAPDACSHFTNRAPHAILHLIREDSITRVLASYPNPENIPEANMATMERLGHEKLQALLASFSQES